MIFIDGMLVCHVHRDEHGWPGQQVIERQVHVVVGNLYLNMQGFPVHIAIYVIILVLERINIFVIHALWTKLQHGCNWSAESFKQKLADMLPLLFADVVLDTRGMISAASQMSALCTMHGNMLLKNVRKEIL